jgi:hypoxanthine phosphoribosyltransferase
LIQLKDKTFKLFIDETTIQVRITQIATAINKDYAAKQPVFLVMLKGAFLFAADLLKQIEVPSEVIFVRLKSYHGTSSTGKVNVLLPIQDDIEGRDIIIIEDIVDSGKTLQEFIPLLEEKNVASIKVASFLFKPNSLQYNIALHYIGIEISNEFVVGYGLDYDELGRNLPAIYQVV